MTTQSIIKSLARNREVFKTLLAGVEKQQIHWKPSEKEWSLLNIICHLNDEETDDFRERVKHILFKPEKPLKPFDPLALMADRNFEVDEYTQHIDSFLKERDRSIAWLAALGDQANWDRSVQHTYHGNISAYQMLANWLAHDHIHIRQINRVKYQYLSEHSKVNLSYAGNW